MAKRNSYALKSDQGNEIFHSWDECQKAMKGRTGISYKAFANDDMCRDWFMGRRPVVQGIIEKAGRVTIYTDGSFNKSIPAYGWGFIAVLPDGNIYTEFDVGKTEGLIPQKNVAGEMVAAMKAVQWAGLHGFKAVELRYDYAGVGNWPLGIQRVSGGNTYAAYYRDWMQKMGKVIEIQYVQIPGHSGDWYNEKADELARKGCGSL